MEKVKYTKCTNCGKESIVTFSDWRNDKGEVLIKKKEHLCHQCAKERKINWKFTK